jgi:Lon protease-like protein
MSRRTTNPLPMFPLGTVLFPSLFLPLHVFEPRYQELTRDCLAGDNEFGVVLIERGSEVGGGDTRFDVGTVARIVEAADLGGGRFALGTVGVRRIRVHSWLPDAPYPRAEVDEWEDAPPSDTLEGLHQANVTTLRRVLAMKAELGEAAVPATVELDSDLILAGYQAAAIAPIGPADHQALLAASSPDERAIALGSLLEDQVELLSFRLG